jgi:Na+:H+ antiporter, NhaA family
MRRFLRNRLSGSESALALAGAMVIGLVLGNLASSPGLQVARSQLLNGPIQYLVIAPFFFLVGLELRREISHGSLKPLRNAIAPALAAILGVAFPALWFALLNWSSTDKTGWPIPTATDVTFALAVYSAFGSSLPRAARTFLLAFAVLDDLIAVVLITLVFGLSGDSGFAELGPVVLAFVVPLRWPTRIESWLLRYLNWVGLPVFAFVVSFISLPTAGAVLGSTVFWGVVARPLWKWLGVFLGGSIGQRWTSADSRLSRSNLAAVALLGGIGFTVSLLVASIAYAHAPEAYGSAVAATFIASAISAIAAARALLRSHRP